uniref:hypothetical protein n=1 Tax=Gemmiger formicilis TaxID=745368 RepID=UPI003FEDB75C
FPENSSVHLPHNLEATIKSKLYQKGRELSKKARQFLNGGLLVQYLGTIPMNRFFHAKIPDAQKATVSYRV